MTEHHADGTKTVQTGTGAWTSLDRFVGAGGHIKLHLYPPSGALPGGRWPSIDDPSKERD
jgi:hypothetical protein